MDEPTRRGRKPRKDKDPMKQCTVRLRRSLWGLAEEAGRRYGVTASFVLRRTLEKIERERGVQAFEDAMKAAA